MSKGKTKALKRHTQQRAHERFGVNVNCKELGEMIRSGRATFVRKQSNRVSLWDVDYRGEPLRVVYDKQRHLPITILTREMGERNEFETAV